MNIIIFSHSVSQYNRGFHFNSYLGYIPVILHNASFERRQVPLTRPLQAHHSFCYDSLVKNKPEKLLIAQCGR